MNVAMLHMGDSPHPAHQGFAEAVDADWIQCSDPDSSPHSVSSFTQEIRSVKKTKKYDVLIAEGARPLYTGLLGKSTYNCNLIYLCADPRFYQLIQNDIHVHSVYSQLKFLLGKYGMSGVKAILSRGIDGVIAVSEFVASYMRSIVGEDTPIKITHPYIQPELYQQLGSLSYNVDSKMVTTVGRDSRDKGVDLLVEAWAEVYKKYPEYQLQIVGEGHPSRYENTPGVIVRGFIDDLAEVYANSGLYVQPSRSDAFGVTVLEALRVGIPPIITETTGAKSEVQDICEELIVPADSEHLAGKIKWFFSLDSDQKLAISKRCVNLGERFSSDSQKQIFESVFEDLVSDQESTH